MIPLSSPHHSPHSNRIRIRNRNRISSTSRTPAADDDNNDYHNFDQENINRGDNDDYVINNVTQSIPTTVTSHHSSSLSPPLRLANTSTPAEPLLFPSSPSLPSAAAVPPPRLSTKRKAEATTRRPKSFASAMDLGDPSSRRSESPPTNPLHPPLHHHHHQYRHSLSTFLLLSSDVYPLRAAMDASTLTSKTILESSLYLLGGPEKLKTANPFVTESFLSPDDDNDDDSMRLQMHNNVLLLYPQPTTTTPTASATAASNHITMSATTMTSHNPFAIES